MTLPTLKPIPFLEALAFWSDKIQITPSEFYALSDRAKALAFTVSGITKGDQLNTVHGLLDKAIRDGITLNGFQSGAGEIFSARGWTGKKPYRVDNILRTNIQTAYNAGKYQALMRNIDIFPYWQYLAIDDARTRSAHALLDDKVFPTDHPFWTTWFPPNGFNCRCSVIGLTAEQVASRGLIVEYDDPTGQIVPLYDENGSFVDNVVLQPDKGFATNPGKTWEQTFGQYAIDKIGSFESMLAQAVMAELVTNEDAAILLDGSQG